MINLKNNLLETKALLNKEVRLLAVSKNHPSDKIKELYLCGQKDFGENKVQELFEKSQSLNDLDINWHFIGHLQSNKINNLLKVKNLKYIHSIDSLSLLRKILNKKPLNKIGLFLQVNTSSEEEKSGLKTYQEIIDCYKMIKENSNFYFVGLMTIGRIRTEDFEKSTHECFSKLNEYGKRLEKEFGIDVELSMGMSADYEIAQEYGTKWVRIGSKLFGKREI